VKLPRDLSGTRLARHLCRAWGYALVHQVGTLNGILQAVAVHKGTFREDLLEDV